MRRESSYDRYNVKEDEFWKQRYSLPRISADLYLTQEHISD